MTPSENSTPNRSMRMWRWVSTLSGMLLWLCVSFWVLALGIFTLVHVLILPRIDVLRPTIERQSSELLGMNVHIESLQASTSGIWPTLELHGVSANDSQQKPVLSLQSAWLSLSWASILRRSLDHLDLEGLELDARLDDQGQWWLGDMRLTGGGSQAGADTFFKIHSFSSKNTQLNWSDELHGHEPVQVKGLSIDIQNGLLSHTFTLDTHVPNSPDSPLSVRAQMHQPLLSLHPGQVMQWSGVLYAQAQNIELATLLKYLSPSVAPQRIEGTGWLRFWGEVNKGQSTNQVLDVSLSNVKSQFLSPHTTEKTGLMLDLVQGRLRSKPWKTGREWETENFEIQVPGQSPAWDLSHLRLRLTDPLHPWSAGAQGEINVGQVFLDKLAQMAEKLAPQHPFTPVLSGLNLKGELKDFTASWTSSDPTPAPSLSLGNLFNGAKKLLLTPSPFEHSPLSPHLSRSDDAKNHGANTEDSSPFSEITQFRLQGHLQGFAREDRVDAKNPAPLLPFATGKGRTGQPNSPSSSPPLSTGTSAMGATKTWLANLPSIKGADITFDVSEHDGHASVSISEGFADLMGALEEPRVEIKKLLADVSWESGAEQLQLHVSNGFVENADGSGRFKFDWKRAWPKNANSATASSASNSSLSASVSDLGRLDLEAQIQHLEVKSLYKYLPQAINSPVRQYLKDALTQGFASQASLKIHGPLNALPFKNPREGELSIQATLNHVGMNYLPKPLTKLQREGLSGTPTVSANANLATELSSTSNISNTLNGMNSLSSEWPSLMDIQGELKIIGPSLSISKASTYMSPEARLFWPRVELKIADMLSPNLEIMAESRSALTDFVSVVNHSPITTLLSNALQKTSARGPADLKLKLNLPLSQIERTKVQGVLTLMNNDLQIAPATPVLTRARGSIAFTEASLSLSNVQARALGGDARIEGGFMGTGESAVGLGNTNPSTSQNLNPSLNTNSNSNTTANGTARDSTNPPSSSNISPDVLQLRVTGQFSAEGLAQACELGWISHLGTLSQGSAPYSAVIVVRSQSGVEVSLSSSLQGLAVSGPAPLNKSASTSLPMTFESVPYKLTTNNNTLNLERMSLVLDDLLLMRLFVDTNTSLPRVYKGALSLRSTNGSQALSNSLSSPTSPTSAQSNNAFNSAAWLRQVAPPTRPNPLGWDLDVEATQLSVDDWQSTLGRFLNGDACQEWPTTSKATDKSNKVSAKTLDIAVDALPSRVNLSAQTIAVQGRNFHQTHLTASRRSEHWLAQIESQELRGSVDLLVSSDLAKRGLNAHLSYLNITPSAPMSSDPLLSQESSLLSWLTLSVDELELKGRPLGKLQFTTHATPGPSGQTVWQFDPLMLSNSDATLTASGHWGPERNTPNNAPQTALNLDLDITNAGNVLDRFGMLGVLKNGKGHLKGQISWGGSLINPNFDQLNGQLNLDVERGQFLKTEPGASRLLGVLNLQALPRRLTLDFRDLFGEGFAFDNIRGDVSVAQGNATTQNLVMKGVSAAVMLEGQANISQESQDVRVVVIPEINAGTASLIYSTINPVVGLTSFLAQYVLRQPLIKANTRTFHINGSWQDPQVTKIDPPLETSP